MKFLKHFALRAKENLQIVSFFKADKSKELCIKFIQAILTWKEMKAILTILTACDVIDDLENKRSASLNFLFRLSTFVFVVLQKLECKKINEHKRLNA